MGAGRAPHSETGMRYVGIDWGEMGWIAVILGDGACGVQILPRIDDLPSVCRPQDTVLIDIPIGLPESAAQAAARPEAELRRRLGPKRSSVFRAPFRQIARAATVEEAWALNRALDAGMTPMSIRGIRRTVNEVDLFLAAHPPWKNRLLESHPEYCFRILNGDTPLLHPKTTLGGRLERLDLLALHQRDAHAAVRLGIRRYPSMKKLDDLLDALCLAVCARLCDSCGARTIPREPAADSAGLYMRIVYPAAPCPPQNPGHPPDPRRTQG